jgi:tetratricopeptide (TPR) repeat protein
MSKDEIARAAAALAEGRAGDAQAICRSVILRVPSDALAHAELGRALRHSRRHDEALAAFERALALAPGLPGVRLDRADELQAVGRNDDAIAR